MSNRKNAALVALLEHTTVAEAAEAIGVSASTVFRYLQDPGFRDRFQKAKADMLDTALTRLQQACSTAVDILVEIMTDKDVPPGVRVRAADSILSRSVDSVKLEALELRLSKLELSK